jgi:hypothetical protein
VRKYINPLTIIAALCGAVLFGGIGVLAVHAATPDSGVAACKTMASNMKKTDNIKSDGPMTASKYHQIRKPFEKSKHSDVRVAGTNIVDTIYNGSKDLQTDSGDPGKSLGKAFALMGTLQAQWGQLQTACGNHGVTVPALPMGDA